LADILTEEGEEERDNVEANHGQGDDTIPRRERGGAWE
jgi:hypothetical protein